MNFIKPVFFVFIFFFSCKGKVNDQEARKSCLSESIIKDEFCLYQFDNRTYKVTFGKGVNFNKRFNPNIVESLSDEQEIDNFNIYTERIYTSITKNKGVNIVKYFSFCRDSLFQVDLLSTSNEKDSLTNFLENNICIQSENLAIKKNNDVYKLHMIITNGVILVE